MATTKIAMQYDLRQSNNSKNASYGKWYPKAVVTSTLNLRGISNHIAEHGSIYTPDVVYGVLKKFTSCTLEMVKKGVGVKLDGLGKFYPTLEAKGSTTAVGYDLNSNLIGVHIRFLPEGIGDDDITSRQLKKNVSFGQRMIFDMNGVPKKVFQGQLVDYGTTDDAEGGEG